VIDIDWGAFTVDSAGQSAVPSIGEAVDWGISVESAPLEKVLESQTIAKDEQEIQLETLLENSEIRSEFVNDLLELQGFFTQRLTEMEDSDNISNRLLMLAPSNIQQQTESSIKGYLTTVNSTMEIINGPKAQQLLMIKHSKRFLDRLVSSVERNLDAIDKINATIQDNIKKRDELKETVAASHPKLDNMIAKTKSLKQQLEGNISKLFKNRKVNIIGEINSL